MLANTDGALAEILEDKQKTYEYVETVLPSILPTYRIAHSAAEFAAAYEALSQAGERVCYKLTRDEGARSFRVIDNSLTGAKAIYEKPGSKISYQDALAVMQGYSFEIPVLLMPYLDGLEISVDCLKTAQGNLIIPRYKMNKRYSEIRFNQSVMDECARLLQAMPCEMPVNIQFKMKEGKPYLLEMNPRMSGGLQLSCKATQINLPSLALKKLLGKPCKWAYPSQDNAKVVHVETPVCLD